MLVQRDGLQAGDLEIHFQMVLQIFTNACALTKNINTCLLQNLARTNTRTLQNLRRVNRPRRQYHLGAGAGAMACAILEIVDSNSALAVKDNPVNQRACFKPHVTTLQCWTQKGICRRPAPPFINRHICRAKTLLPIAIVIRRYRIASLLAGAYKGFM